MRPNEITLWETAGIRCVLAHPEIGRALFEITVLHRKTVLTRMTFEQHQDAADFAIACMHKDSQYWQPLVRVATAG